MSPQVAQFAISTEAVLDFGAASGDINPLHSSTDYARQTPFGQPIVHGALGFLTACAYSRMDLDTVTTVSARFLAPMFANVLYSVRVVNSPDSQLLSVFDGGRVILEVYIRPGAKDLISVLHGQPTFPLSRPNTRLPTPGSDITTDAYWPDLARIRELLSVGQEAIVPDWLIAGAATASFTIGMVFPGERALLRSFEIPRPVSIDGPLGISVAAPTSASVARGLARVQVLATGLTTEWSFSATASIRPMSETLKLPERPPSLTGKSALVVGASRGLGAALRNELLARSCRTWALQRTPDALAASPFATVISADATDKSRMMQVRDSIAAETGGLDLLVLNATSTLQSMWVDEAHHDRIASYLDHEIRLFLTPLTILIPLLRPGGVCTFVSSQILEADDERISTDALEWAHYVAAKAAGEALLQVASLEYPSLRFVVARLPLLNTQLTARTTIDPGHRSDIIAKELIDAWTSSQPSPYDAIITGPIGSTP